LDLFKGINDKYDMALLIITHDFDVAKYICDRIVIMYGGLVVEEGSTTDITENPLHPYTKELIKCAQSLDNEEEIIYSLEGMPPTPLEFGDKCPFYNRCNKATDKCLERIPELEQLQNRKVRCIHRS
jgi:peptide/nickel transport system ATP-binding protein